MILFVDSSGWIALFGRNDKFHEPAAHASHSLQGKTLRFITTDYVFDETVTFLRKQVGFSVAQRCGKAILDSTTVDFIKINDSIWQPAWEMFQAYEDKRWSFTDCTSFALMQQRQIFQAFTFDDHFAQAGFQLWPA